MNVLNVFVYVSPHIRKCIAQKGFVQIVLTYSADWVKKTLKLSANLGGCSSFDQVSGVMQAMGLMVILWILGGLLLPS